MSFVSFHCISRLKLTPLAPGKPYNLTRILNADSTFNHEAYKAYSPLFLSYASFFAATSQRCILTDRTATISATFAISYGLAFASITATIVHAALYFRKPIMVHLQRSLAEQPDVHAQLMAKYPQGEPRIENALDHTR